MTVFYDPDDIRKIYARLDGMKSRQDALEKMIRLQVHQLRAMSYLLKSTGVSLEEQENWWAELRGDI